MWERIEGRQRLYVIASSFGTSFRDAGLDVSRLMPFGQLKYDGHPGYGVWFESIIPDVNGVWYGFYHNEWPAYSCERGDRAIPRIGAARSRNFGTTWQDLGIVLEAPAASYDCATTNEYFVGGVGDFSVLLDDSRQYLYLFFTQYGRRDRAQGVAVARLAWADVEAPAGRSSVWLRDRTWLPARVTYTDGEVRYVYPPGAPIYRVSDGWHDDETVDAFWGPSVHWNTHLQQYVMLLNRASNSSWAQEGIYVAFASRLDDPAGWSTPERLLGGGLWYPQVIGLEIGTGTDRLAGERARFFMGGQSEYFIEFSK